MWPFFSRTAAAAADPSINRKGASFRRCGLVIRSCSFGVLLDRLVLILVLLLVLCCSGLTLEEVHIVAFLGFVQFYSIPW